MKKTMNDVSEVRNIFEYLISELVKADAVYIVAPEDMVDSLLESFEEFDGVKEVCMFPALRRASEDDADRFCDDFLDLKLSYRVGGVFTKDGEDFPASMEITPRMLDVLKDKYGVTKEDIVKKAMSSIAEVYEPHFLIAPEMPVCDFVCVSSDKRNYGASVILCPGLLKDYSAHKGNTPLFLLPSSIHEMIILAPKGNGMLTMDSVSDLRDMVRVGNRTTVEPGDVLSYEVYIYDPETDQITIAP